MVIMSSSILPLSGAPNQMPKHPAEATGCYHCSLPLGDAPVRMELDGQ